MRKTKVNEPWLILGDFDVVHKACEGKGKSSPTEKSMGDFNQLMEDLNLLVSPKRIVQHLGKEAERDDLTLCGINRALYNEEMMNKYQQV